MTKVKGTNLSIGNSAKLQDKPALSKKNVMNTIHNVTVSSPPTSAGKERSTSLVNIRENNDELLSKKQLSHSRSRTRTIAPEESILFQRKLISSKSIDEVKPKIEKKNPVAYEINFEEEQKAKKWVKKPDSIQSDGSVENVIKTKKPLVRQKSIMGEKVLVRQKTQDIQQNKAKESEEEFSNEKKDEEENAEEDDNYESDFESYESDFEAESSNQSDEKLSEESDSDSPADMEVAKIGEKSNTERIDSGSFDMSVKKSITPSLNQYDSIEDTVNSHDSGISYDDMQALNKRLLSPKVIAFYKRGEELMKKITFDEISFEMYEQKPIPYEMFMSIYGQRGMMQSSTQCEHLLINEDCQTDVINKLNSWTQFPTKFTCTGLENINSKLYNEEKLGIGDEVFEYTEKDTTAIMENIDMSIEAINNFTDESLSFPLTQHSSYIVSDLRNFIENASVSILNILEGKSNKTRELLPSKISISSGCFELKFADIEILNDTIITKVWSNVCLTNYLITIHKSINTSQNFMCLWNILHVSRPLKIFNAWNDINCIEIHPQQRDFILAGCNDGTICMWNIQENSFPANAIQPCEIISLNQFQNDFSLDNVIALRYLSQRKFKTTISMFTQSQSAQFCSLHENGVLSIWTLFNIENREDVTEKCEMDFTCNESRVKLIKNLSIDINQLVTNCNNENEKNVRKKSAFDKTRYYFENDLFSDKVLRELQEIDEERFQRCKNFMYRNEMFTAITFDLNFNEFFIASDINFIVAMSRLCLGEKSRKIITNESNFISPSVIKVHPIDKNILAVGQTNGSVKFIKTNDDFDDSSLNKRKQLKRSNAAFSNEENVLAKSCAFQNIVEREKKLYEETQALNNLASDEMKAFMFNESLLSMPIAEKEENFKSKMKIVYDKNLFNSFDIGMGTVRLIEFSRTGQYMFVVINKELKIFNCWTNAEVYNTDNRMIEDVKCVLGSDGSEYLVRKFIF